MIKLSRDMDKYADIENIEDFELSSSVAFEMALRHPEVIRLKKEIDTMLQTVGQEYVYERDNDTGLSMEYDILEKEFMSRYDNYDKFDEATRKELRSLYIPEFDEFFINNNIKAKKLTSSLQILLDDYWIRYFFDKHMLYRYFDSNNQDYIDRENLERLKENLFIRELIAVRNSKDGRVVISGDPNLYFGLEGAEQQIDINKMIFCQRIDSLVVPKDYDKRIDVKINIALPKNELLAYISVLKDSYDDDTGAVKTPLELLGDELKEADYKICDIDEDCFDARSYLSTQHKLADMLFIYDALSAGWKKADALNDIFWYDIDKSDSPKNIKKMDRKTLNKYFEIAKEYIEGKKYQELAAGVKIRK